MVDVISPVNDLKTTTTDTQISAVLSVMLGLDSEGERARKEAESRGKGRGRWVCHWMPVIDPATGNAVHLLTSHRLLIILAKYARQLPVPAHARKPITEIPQLGNSFSDLVTVNVADPVSSALELFVTADISCLPVISLNRRPPHNGEIRGPTFEIVDILTKRDVRNVLAATVKNFGQIEERLGAYVALLAEPERNLLRGELANRVVHCPSSATPADLLELMAKHAVRWAIVSNASTGYPEKLIAVPDLLKYLIFPEYLSN